VGANVVKHPGVFDQVVGGGHVVGNHTHNHLNGWKYGVEHYVENVGLCSTVLGAYGRSALLRPPYGRITRAQYGVLSRRYKIVMWTVLTQDFSPADSADRSLRKALDAVVPGSVIVFHDNIKAERKVRYMLPRFIEACLERGYQFKPLE
jgi:peptidoglycan/xylan/chitin deacetylase (PgdA/CDA1 family)